MRVSKKYIISHIFIGRHNMVLVRVKNNYDKYSSGNVKSHITTIEMLETVDDNDMYYIKRVMQWKVDVGVDEEDLLPKRLNLQFMNDNVRKVAGKIVFNNECKENYNVELIKEEVTTEYTPSVEMFFDAAKQIYINADTIQ